MLMLDVTETKSTTDKMDVCAHACLVPCDIANSERTSAKIIEEIYSPQTSKSRSSRPLRNTTVSRLGTPVP